MKPILTTIVTLILSSNLYGQSFSDLWKQKDLGIGVNLYSFKGYSLTDTSFYTTSNLNNAPDTIELGSTSSYGVTVFAGWNFPLINLAEGWSVGINPNLAFTAGLSGGFGMFLEIPVFATLKYGTDATWSKSTSFDKKFGAAIGIGYQATLGYTEAPITTTGISAVYALPTIMAEVSFVRNKKTLYKVRFQTNLGRTKQRDYSEEVGYPANVSFSQWGISIIRTKYGR